MLKKVKEKINLTVAKIRTNRKQWKGPNLTVHKVLIGQKGSGLVEYIGIAAAALALIVVVVLPGMKNLFGVDVFPGLTSAVNKIFNFS